MVLDGVRPVSVTVKPVVDEGFANAHCDTGALSTNSWDRDTRKVGFHLTILTLQVSVSQLVVLTGRYHHVLTVQPLPLVRTYRMVTVR